MTIKVVYENGVFRPTEKVNLSEGTVGEVALPKNGSASRGERDPQNLAVIMEAVRALANRYGTEGWPRGLSRR